MMKGVVCFLPEYSEEKWAKAAAACRDVIDLDVYELNIVNKSTSDNGPSERPTVTPPADGRVFQSTLGQKDGQILTRSDHIVLSLMVLYYLQTIKN